MEWMIWAINIQPFLPLGINSNQNNYFPFIFHLKRKNMDSAPQLIIWDIISVRIRMYIGLSFTLLLYLSGILTEGFLYFTNATQSTPFVRTASIESLHLSFFYSVLSLWTFAYFRNTGFGSGLPIFNSRVSLNLKVIT